MDVLRKVEDKLGSIEEWPTYVLLNMFVYVPDHNSVKKVSSFFYGNRVDRKLAAECYAKCNAAGSPDIITDAVFQWYFTWQQQKNLTYFYYNMRTGKFMRISGKEDEDLKSLKVPEKGVECMKSIDRDTWISLKRAIQLALGEKPLTPSDDEVGDVLIYDERKGEWRMV
jgi:hypothetical protein